jgi:5-methyltetrahydropteroyltriglutamate--homocysteine methyltransferase
MEAVNAATANIPPEAMRLHICWGNYEGPHTRDLPLATIFPILMRSRPAGILFEGANPRHEHEWEDIKDAKIPDHKVLIPGVIDSTSNFVEHPKLIAQRICHYADIVGRERVIASSDCGFGTFAKADPQVATSIVWSKFRAMAEGAAIATERLW